MDSRRKHNANTTPPECWPERQSLPDAGSVAKPLEKKRDTYAGHFLQGTSPFLGYWSLRRSIHVTSAHFTAIGSGEWSNAGVV